MKRATSLARWAFRLSQLLCVAACKESMHDAPTEEPAAPKEEPAPVPAPAPTPTPAKTDETVTAAKTADGKEMTSDGYPVVRAKPNEAADVEVKTPPGWKLAQKPDTPDPHGGKFTLDEALKGLPAQGKLKATIRTSLGSFDCQLFDDKAPTTVANFVGLARGVRKFWSAKDHAWVARPYYDGTTFHRVIPEFMIQGGDWAGDGTGNMYFTIPDELHPSLKHDRGGLLCMANRGPNTNEAQFFITEQGAAHLDTSYTIFGECSPVELVRRIARVPQGPGNKPLTPVVIERVTIERKGGAAAAAKPSGNTTAAPTAPAAPPPLKAVKVDPPATEATPQ
jgi:peptidyl-prolyl cis-trans isomerase A (cyclophilin A)